jgi:hypothetical protein
MRGTERSLPFGSLLARTSTQRWRLVKSSGSQPHARGGWSYPYEHTYLARFAFFFFLESLLFFPDGKVGEVPVFRPSSRQEQAAATMEAHGAPFEHQVPAWDVAKESLLLQIVAGCGIPIVWRQVADMLALASGRTMRKGASMSPEACMERYYALNPHLLKPAEKLSTGAEGHALELSVYSRTGYLGVQKAYGNKKPYVATKRGVYLGMFPTAMEAAVAVAKETRRQEQRPRAGKAPRNRACPRSAPAYAGKPRGDKGGADTSSIVADPRIHIASRVASAMPPFAIPAPIIAVTPSYIGATPCAAPFPAPMPAPFIGAVPPGQFPVHAPVIGAVSIHPIHGPFIGAPPPQGAQSSLLPGAPYSAMPHLP